MIEAPNLAPLVEAPAKGRDRTAQGRRPLRGAVDVLPLSDTRAGRPAQVGGFSTKQQDSRESQVVSGPVAGPRAFSASSGPCTRPRHSAGAHQLVMLLDAGQGAKEKPDRERRRGKQAAGPLTGAASLGPARLNG
jgi:hypothetical protein